MESASLGNDGAFSWAIMSLFAWLVPHLSTEIGEYHRALRTSHLWSSNESTMAAGKSAVRRAASSANAFSILLIVAAACGVALTTKNLEKRMVSIVTGLSRLTGSTVLFALSWRFPEWLEVYHIRQPRDVLPLIRSIKDLKLNVFLCVVRQYFLVYFFLLPFYCGAGPLIIPVSAVVGLIIGCIVNICVFWGRKHVSDSDTKVAPYIIFAMISITILFSASLFANGCTYIHDVWVEKDPEVGFVLGTFFAWLVAGALVHFFLWRLTKVVLKERLDEEANPQEDVALAQSGKVSVGDRIPEETRGQAHEGKEEPDTDRHFDLDFMSEPTYCSLVTSKVCGSADKSCCSLYSDEKETRGAKFIACVKWTVWVILTCASLYFVIINIGATHQQDVVRDKLPSVKKLLYEKMNDIEVCAYDGNGTEGSLNEHSTIITFPSKDAAHYAGYLILHCGPCGACSTWPNIKYEYTTRNILAKEAAKCGRISLIDGEEAVHSCLMAPPINWDDDCARCWTTDILCTKTHCTFNFLQSRMLNAMTDFAVGINQVTSATCEEANCEAFGYPANFVECSGATRRRMNVNTMIDRDKSEQCAIVDVSWERLFPGE